MIRVKGRYSQQSVQLDQPLDLAEGAEIEILIPQTDQERDDWATLGMSRLEEAWDNPQDAIYNDWKKHYGA